MPTMHEPDDERDVRLAVELPPMRVKRPSPEALLGLCDRVGADILRVRGDGAEDRVRLMVRSVLGEWTTWSAAELEQAVAVTVAGVVAMHWADRG